MVQCPSCARQQEPRLLCSTCGAPLPAELDYFGVLGLPRKLTLDLQQLESIYHEVGRRVHPDRFATQSEAVREASLKSTALLTQSYRILRDPISRGRYWLELHGEKLAESNKQVPAELAELVFEVQEELAQLRGANRDDRDVVSGLVSAIRERRQALRVSMEEAHGALAETFGQWDRQNRNEADLIMNLKAVLSKIAYLGTLIRDVDRELEPFDAS